MAGITANPEFFASQTKMRLAKPLRSALAGAALMAGMLLPAEEPPVLSLSQAVQIALDNNRPATIAKLDIAKSQWQVAQTKTKRFPAITTYLFASGNLTSPTFDFPAGLFVANNGAEVPGKDTKVSLSQGVTGNAAVQIAQPLSQLYQIHLAIRLQELYTDLARRTIQGKAAVAGSECEAGVLRRFTNRKLARSDPGPGQAVRGNGSGDDAITWPRNLYSSRTACRQKRNWHRHGIRLCSCATRSRPRRRI